MNLSAYDLTGRTACVPGAASGIGRVGAALVTREGGTAHPHPLDATDRRTTTTRPRAPKTNRPGPAAQEQAEAATLRHAPLRRVGEPEGIAHAALPLAPGASSFTTGQIPRPNGGAAMPW
ncbi:hypothetical protein ABZ618_21935 [Streptomyces roseolus]